MFCSKRNPNCSACPLRSQCEYARANGRSLQRPKPPQGAQGAQVPLETLNPEEQGGAQRVAAQGAPAEHQPQLELPDQPGRQGPAVTPQAGVLPPQRVDAPGPGLSTEPDQVKLGIKVFQISAFKDYYKILVF